MAHIASPGLTRQEGRRFALTLAGAFAVLGLVGSWRERAALSLACALLSALLLGSALLIPEKLGPIERAWTQFGLLISRFTSPLFLGLVYFAVFTPVAYLRRVMGKNSMDRAAVRNSYWIERAVEEPDDKRRKMERQF